MTTEHRARITWSSGQLERGLPDSSETIDPCWFAGDAIGPEGWSLVCRFERPPRDQGNPSLAVIQFLMPDAPHHRLVPGALLSLFERATHRRAIVEVLD